MDVLIKGLALPTGDGSYHLTINSIGNVIKAERIGYRAYTAIELPEHGDLCDKDELMNEVDSTYMWEQAVRKVRLAPVIVEASDGSDN